MVLLILASAIWAFSFSLIKTALIGIPSSLVTFLRLFFSLLVFLPFFSPRRLTKGEALKLCGIGAIQYGFMYLLFNYSFHFLKAYEVALFTSTTPLYVVFLDSLIKKRKTVLPFVSAGLAVIAALLVVYRSSNIALSWKGIVVLQVSNICFALGQLFYRNLPEPHKEKPHEVFALLYLGGVLVSLVGLVANGDIPSLFILTDYQWAVLLYLGAVASGVGFFLWNVGATKVSVGVLSVMNNCKIPFAVIVSLVLFREEAHFVTLASGMALFFLAYWIQKR